MIRSGRRLASLALTATLAVGAAACGGDDEPEAGDDPAPSATVSAEPTDSPTADATEDASSPATEPTEPAVAPATGILLQEEVSAVNAPEGWELSDGLVDYASSADGPGSYDTMLLVDHRSLAGADTTAEELFESWVDLNKKEFTYQRLPDLDLDGTPATYVAYQYKDGDDSLNWEVSAVHNGNAVTLDITLNRGTLKKNPQLVDSVIASLRWLD